MKQYIISAILLYALFVVIYLLREQIRKRKSDIARNSTYNLFRSTPIEDIIGKSKFNLRHSLPKATTLIYSEKDKENDSIFAKEIEKRSSAVIPLDKLDEVFSKDDISDDDSNDINVEIDNTPPEFEPDYDSEEIDEDDIEEDDTKGRAGASFAQGLDFNDLANMVRTVDASQDATDQEKEEAGRVLVEIRETDMFEQVVSTEPRKKVVSSLMDEYFAVFQRKKREAGEIDEPKVKAPKEFDVRNFA